MNGPLALATTSPVSQIPLRYLVTCLDGKRVPLNAEQRSQIAGDIPYWGANSVVDYINDWLFDEDLVLLGEDGAPFCEIGKDVAFFVRGKVWVNNHTHVLRASSGVSARFLTYALNCVDYGKYINGSTRDKLTQDSMRSILIPVPDINAQIAIHEFLDRETAEADALVAKYERLIELLEEKRVALITQAVTKGLDPSAPMKDSGIKWIGEIPVHWNCNPLRRYAHRLQYGATESGEHDLLGAPRYIRITDIDSSGQLRNDDIKFLPRDVASQYMLDDGDVLFARSGATVGKAFLYLIDYGPACFAGYLIRAQLNKKIVPKFLYHFSNSRPYWAYIGAAQSQATIENVNASLYGSMPIPVPPISEQRDIVRHLDQQIQVANDMIDKAQKAIALIREHRSALITAAVTGQIDVSTYRSRKQQMEVPA